MIIKGLKQFKETKTKTPVREFSDDDFIYGKAPPERGTFFHSSFKYMKEQRNLLFRSVKGLKRPVRCFYVFYGCEKVKKKRKKKNQKTFWSVIYLDFKDSAFKEVKRRRKFL